MNTRKLYYENPRNITFSAEILSCQPYADTYQITLNQTAFFPEEGGQSASLGTLNEEPVLHVTNQNDILIHQTKIPFPVGSFVTGEVDWSHRFDQMQQHSGEHIVSGLVHHLFGYDNVGFHLGSDQVTLDFNGVLTKENLEEIEFLANQAIYRNIDVLITFPDSDTLASLTYRSKLALTENVRIVTFPDYDICACCAPHVANTGEIGMIRIVGVQNYKGGVRVNILCGNRALLDYRKKSASVLTLSQKLSVTPDAIVTGVEALEQTSKDLKERLNTLQASMLQLKIDSLPKDITNVLLTVDDLDNIAVRTAVNYLVTLYPGYCCICIGSDATGFQFILASKERDCLCLTTPLKEHFNTKCGGSSQMIQGRHTSTICKFTEWWNTLD